MQRLMLLLCVSLLLAACAPAAAPQTAQPEAPVQAAVATAKPVVTQPTSQEAPHRTDVAATDSAGCCADGCADRDADEEAGQDRTGGDRSDDGETRRRAAAAGGILRLLVRDLPQHGAHRAWAGSRLRRSHAVFVSGHRRFTKRSVQAGVEVPRAAASLSAGRRRQHREAVAGARQRKNNSWLSSTRYCNNDRLALKSRRGVCSCILRLVVNYGGTGT